MFPKSLDNRGIVLPLVFVFVVVLAVMVATYLYMVSFQTKNIGYQQQDVRALSIAEAGQEKAIWYLRNIAPDASNDGSWRVALPGRTETPVGWTDSYTMVVDDWDLADTTKPAPFNSVTCTATINPIDAPNLIDGDTGAGSRWQTPNGQDAAVVTITFPANANYRVNKAGFRRTPAGGPGRPQDYTWEVSADGSGWTVGKTVVNNNNNNPDDFFTDLPLPYVANNVNFLRLNISNASGNRIRLNEIVVYWTRIKSSCILDKSSKYVRQCILVTPLAGPNTITKVPNTWKEINVTTFNDPLQF